MLGIIGVGVKIQYSWVILRQILLYFYSDPNYQSGF